MSRLTLAAALRALLAWRAPSRYVLGVALAASFFAHLLAASWPQHAAPATEPLPMLAATITTIPPPPPPVRRIAPRHKPKPAPQPAPELASSGSHAPALVAAASVPETAPLEPVREAVPAPEPTEETLPTSLPDPVSPQPLPPRIELVYRGFLGTQGFFVGDAVYLLEHAANQYRITTVGEARGLAALFLPGQGRLTSTGTITRAGLQPELYTAERSSDGRHETATFDWETGVVLLNDSKTAGLELPTFDPLMVLWQFYFSPPGPGRCRIRCRHDAPRVPQSVPPRGHRDGQAQLRRRRGTGLGAQRR